MDSDAEVAIPEGTIVLEKYRVVRTLGIGGMGLVVEAIHTQLGTPVAIKFLLPQFAASAEAGRRFVREAQAASKITSEHSVRVFDAGTSQPYGPYIVMEFLQGNDLSRYLRQSGVFSVEVAIDFAVQAGLALGEAHANGVVHRDVKPANLFLVEQPDGSQLVKVLDFGISKVVEETSLEVTKTSAILGSGLYMSPEQMKSSKTVDHRTDIYALGVSLFELLTRTQPYTADSFAELAIKVNMEAPTDIRTLRPDVSTELAAVIERAYAKKADDRFQSMGELALALEPWAAMRTRPRIQALARTETRRGRAPSTAPSALEAHGSLTNLRLPPPPSLPTPSSLGMDTFGLSNKKGGADALGQTADKSFVSGDKQRSNGGLLAVGVAVGVLAAGGLAFFLLRPPADAQNQLPSARSNALVPAASAASTESARSRVDVVVSTAESAAQVVATGSQRPSTSAKAHATSNVQAASAQKTSTATGDPQPTGATPATTPTSTGQQSGDPPCKIRDLDGTLRDCPKN